MDRLCESLLPSMRSILKDETEHILNSTKNQVLLAYEEESKEQIRELNAALGPIQAATRALYTEMKQRGAFSSEVREIEVSQ